MLPYFENTTISIGPITVYLWGLFIACGIMVMLIVAKREARQYRVSYDALVDLVVWSLVAAFVGARLSHVFLYEPAYYLDQLLEIFKVWNGGMSSLGGMVFGTAAALIFVWRRHLDVRAVGDVLFRSMPFAWAIGRFGCYMTHMHPGLPTTSVLGVRYPDALRWDLGLLESLVWVAIALIISVPARRRTAGAYVVLVPLLYAPARFMLDFLRTDDTRYALLTPAQYGMIVVFMVAVALSVRWRIFKKL